MEIREISRLVQNGRYEVDAGLVAQAILDRVLIPDPTGRAAQGLPEQLSFDPRWAEPRR